MNKKKKSPVEFEKNIERLEEIISGFDEGGYVYPRAGEKESGAGRQEHREKAQKGGCESKTDPGNRCPQKD